MKRQLLISLIVVIGLFFASSYSPVKAGVSLFTNTPWCGNSTDPAAGIDTALGCIPNDYKAFVAIVFRWGVGIASGVAIMAMSYAGFLIISSQGDPKKVKAGQEIFVSSIEGIALIALAVVFLNFLGVEVLGLDLFGFTV